MIKNIEKIVVDAKLQVVLLKKSKKIFFNRFTSLRNGLFYDLPDKEWPTNEKKEPLMPLLQLNFSEVPFDHDIKKYLQGLTVFIDKWVECDCLEAETSSIKIRELPLGEKLKPLKKPRQIQKLLNEKLIFESTFEYPVCEDYWLVNPEFSNTSKEDFYKSIDENHLEELIKKYPNYDQSKLLGWPINRQWGCHFLSGDEYFLIQITYDFDLPFGDCAVLYLSKEKKDSGWRIHWESY